MKKLLLATVATAALSLPVMAQSASDTQSRDQQQMHVSPQTSGQASDQQSPSQTDQSQQQTQNTIDPSQLSTQQIRQIQQALNQQGFDAGHVDGKWGPDTDKAVKDFQQNQNMQANGLDQQTLQSLGVNVAAQGQTGQSRGASTTGQGADEIQPRLQPNGQSQQDAAPSGQSQSDQQQ